MKIILLISLNHPPLERQKAIRTAITSARLIYPDDLSRHAKLQAAKKIWNESQAAASSLAEIYLTSCGLVCDADLLAHVRFHPRVLHEPTKENMPAMIAPFTNLEGQFVGIHKTYLAADGKSMAQVKDGPRRMLGECFGSYIHLKRMSGFKLLIAESMEMGLAIRQSCPDLPVWVSMRLGNMKSPVPSMVKELILCTDGPNKDQDIADKIVKDAAREQMHRAITVRIVSSLSVLNTAPQQG
jgi:hypothetical protein